jgi:MFS family permease
MVVLDFSIVNVALPSIERELGVTTAVAQWVVIQGVGAAAVAPAALSLITTSFPQGPRRTRAIGLYGSISSVGFVSGQVLGGVLIEWTSWRSVFLVNVPFGLAAALLAPRIVGSDRAPGTRKPAAASGASTSPGASSASASGGASGATPARLDIRGAVLITAAVALAVFAISQAGELGWTSPLVLAALVVAIAASAGFAAAEARHPEPLIRPRMLLRPGLRNGALIALLLGLWNGGEMLALSLYLQQALHYSPLATGLVIAPQGVAGFTSGLLGPKIAARFGVRRTLVLAGAIAAVGFVALAWLPSAGYSPLLLMVMPVGLGTAGTSFGSMVLVSRGMADRDQGLVGGVVNTSRQIGAAIGAALLPAIAEAVGGVTGDRAAMLAGACAAFAATVIAVLASRASATPAPAMASSGASAREPSSDRDQTARR